MNWRRHHGAARGGRGWRAAIGRRRGGRRGGGRRWQRRAVQTTTHRFEFAGELVGSSAASLFIGGGRGTTRTSGMSVVYSARLAGTAVTFGLFYSIGIPGPAITGGMWVDAGRLYGDGLFPHAHAESARLKNR